MDAAATDWRISLQLDNRQCLVSMIIETLKNCFPDFGPERLIKLTKMAKWYEEENYTAAKDKLHYLRKISLKIRNMETIFQTTGMPNTIQSNPAVSTQNPLAPGKPKYFWDIMDAATDRRISLQPDDRQSLVNIIMETLKNCFPDSVPERLAKLNKMAEWYEEESYIAATNMSDYLRKLSLKILHMEEIFLTTGMPSTIQSKSAGSTQNPLAPASHDMQSQLRNQQKPQIPLPNQSQVRRRIKPQRNTIVNARVQSSASLPSAPYVTSLSQTSLSKAVCQSNNTQSGISQNSVGSSVRQGIPSFFSNLQFLYQQLRQQILPSSIDSEAQTPHAVVYQKYQPMKEMHLPCLIDAYQKICIKCQQFDSRPNVSDSSVEIIKLVKNTVERSMLMLNVSKNNIVFAEKIISCEEEMISFLSSNSPQKPISAQQHIRKHFDHPQQQHQQQQQQQQLKPDNQMNHQMQPTNMQNSVSSKQSTAVTSTRHESINSNAQTTLNVVHQQEEIYKKIQFMKEKYLPGLNDMYQNISIECEQHDDSLLNVPNSERIERLKLTKNMLEFAIRILNLSKSSIVPPVESISYKKMGQDIIRFNRPQIPVSVQQQVRQPGGHPLSMRPQQQQHPDNPMQPTNMQKSVSSKQSTAVTSTCHASTDSEAQKGQNAFDWQEETYQKIQSMKKKYLPSLNDMYQQITINCQQPDSLPNVPKSNESGKMIKKGLEAVMKILDVSKDNIVPAQKEKLDMYEKMILLILSKRPPKPVSEAQQQKPEKQQQEAQQQSPEQHQEAPQQQQQQEAQQQPQQQQQEEAKQQQEAQQQSSKQSRPRMRRKLYPSQATKRSG